MQLCHNELNGSIPTELGKLKRLSVLALQYNHLSGAIPASLGELETLERLDLSFNTLLGPIPVTLANAPKLETLDIRNNSLSGSVPTGNKSNNTNSDTLDTILTLTRRQNNVITFVGVKHRYVLNTIHVLVSCYCYT